ncbi:MAG: class I adenylate-forming enzyme family protein [Burkholderiaceae bacterium]|jgi:acyl-CoA synthetase (AMP-forming)/AMP-acid ligase II
MAAGLRIVDLLRHHAEQTPNRVALRIDGEPRSFLQLHQGVLQVAGRLQAIARPGDRVGLWFHNCFAWVECFLALDLLGAVSVPINTRLTGSELRVIMEAAALAAIITTPHYRKRRYTDEAIATLAPTGRSLAVLEASDTLPPSDWPVITLEGERATLPRSPADVFCIQYTSGTTSVPKGVMLTDAAYLQTASYVVRCQRLTPTSRFISAAPFFHCSGTMHALTVCLLAGCTLDSLSVWDPEQFVDTVALRQCDTAHMIYFRDVLAIATSTTRERLSSLQVAHDLGTPEFLLRIADQLGVTGISNLYGMTETCGQFTMWTPGEPLAQRVGGNGRPQPGNKIRIVDPDSSAELPAGATGEIQMRGPTITQGYFANAEAMASGFSHDGWFRSGDLGRIGDDGELIYVARLKEMIRVGGENLAPVEVEQVLRDLCRTAQVCALGVPDPRLDEVVAAVLVAPQVSDWTELLARLRERLAGFKVPRAVYVADSLPMTATNRVQRATLKHWIESGQLQRVM